MSIPWIPQIGLTFSIGIDKFSLMMVWLTAIISASIIIVSKTKSISYYIWLFVLTLNAVLLFISRDVLMFYILFEFLMLPFFFLIGKHSNAPKTALKYLLYSFFGGVVMLFGIVILYNSGLGKGGFEFENVKNVFAHMSVANQHLVFISFFIGFAIKAPLFPLHSWLKDVAEKSKPEISAFLISVFDKMGTFGMIYILVNLMPSSSYYFRNTICVLAIISIIYSAFVALYQKNILTLIGFSSISHFGFIILGIFAFNSMALKGAKLFMLAHGITICLLFILSSILFTKEKSYDFSKLKGLQRKEPFLSTVFLISLLSLIAVPGTISFPGEFMIIVGAFQVHKIWAGFALFGAILGAVYCLLAYQNIWTGKTIDNKTIKVPLKSKLLIAEKIIPIILVLIIIVFGFFPMILV